MYWTYLHVNWDSLMMWFKFIAATEHSELEIVVNHFLTDFETWQIQFTITNSLYIPNEKVYSDVPTFNKWL